MPSHLLPKKQELVAVGPLRAATTSPDGAVTSPGTVRTSGRITSIRTSLVLWSHQGSGSNPDGSGAATGQAVVTEVDQKLWRIRTWVASLIATTSKAVARFRLCSAAPRDSDQ